MPMLDEAILLLNVKIQLASGLACVSSLYLEYTTIEPQCVLNWSLLFFLIMEPRSSHPFSLSSSLFREGAVVQSGERATSDKEVVGSIPAPGARSLLVGSVSV